MLAPVTTGRSFSGNETMHPKVLTRQAWTIVRQLTAKHLLDGWQLAGGTGLALQLGHRSSEDLNLFSSQAFDPDTCVHRLASLGKVMIQHRAAGTLHAAVDGIRVSFLQSQSEFLFAGTPYRGLTVADPRDIAIMKLVAVGGCGSRKDFVDLFFLFRSGVGLETTLDLLRQRFSGVDYNEYHLMKSLVYFDDAEAEPMPTMIRQVPWDEIKTTIIAEVRRLA